MILRLAKLTHLPVGSPEVDDPHAGPILYGITEELDSFVCERLVVGTGVGGRESDMDESMVGLEPIRGNRFTARRGILK